MPIEVRGLVGERPYTLAGRQITTTHTEQEGRAEMRFVHTADWQLGMTRHFLNGEAQPRYAAARREAVAALGPIAARTGAEFVVVAGDVFEHNQLEPRVVSQSLEAMRAIGVPVYLLPGNHDPLDAASVYTSSLFVAESPGNVTVLDRPGVHEVRPSLQIVAAPWRSKAPTTDLVAEVLDGLPADGVTRILVGHGGVDVLDPDPGKPSLIRLASLQDGLTRGAVHYVALGDKHSRTEVGDTGRVWYSGSPEVTNYDNIEADPGHVLIVDIDDADPRTVQVTSESVGRWRFVTLTRTVDTGRDVTDLDLNLDLMPDKERTVVQLALNGSLTVTDRAALDACLDKYARLFASLRLWERHTDLAVVPADGEFDDLGVGGFAAAAVQELVATARAGNDDADDARAALALLLRLVDTGAA
jgi:DNA repair exonuclease SbcCD nuclease subunit